MKNPKPALRRPTLRTLLLPAVMAALGGCAIAPPTPPAPPQPPLHFKEDALWKHAAGTAAPAAATVTEAWWRVFDDPVLDDLQGRLVIGNNNLRAAAAQVASAKAVLEGSRAAQGPTLSVTGNDSRGKAGSLNSATLQASAAWEVDLWGRLSGGVQVAGANLQASQDDLAALRLSAQATLVQGYFALRTAEAQQALLQRSLESDGRALALTQARQASGVAALSDVLQAQTQLDTVRAQAHEQALARAQAEHAIAVLLGEAPAAFGITPTARLPAMPQLPPLLPSTLLERRPDIAAAERRVAAAYAQIGVTNAAFYPQLSLSGATGVGATSLRLLTSAPTAAWSLGASAVGAILDGGQRQQAAGQARAAADQAAASYRQTVLTAFQEVEDNLVVADQLTAELLVQQRALAAARRTLEIVQEQYRAGTVSFLNVATAQTTALQAEGNLLSLQGRQLTAAGVLLKNIGGRWQAS